MLFNISGVIKRVVVTYLVVITSWIYRSLMSKTNTYPRPSFFIKKVSTLKNRVYTYKEINTTSLNLQMQQQKELSKGSHFSTTFFSPTTTPSSSYHPELQARKQQESSRCSFLLLLLTIRVLHIIFSVQCQRRPGIIYNEFQ